MGLLFAGGMAGAISRTATSPFEVVRIRFQTGIAAYKGAGILESFRLMYIYEGWRSFFKGNFVNILKRAPFSAI